MVIEPIHAIQYTLFQILYIEKTNVFYLYIEFVNINNIIYDYFIKGPKEVPPMNSCPSCLSALSQQQAVRGAHLEHCQACGVAWLDFSQHRPLLYAQLEKQVRRWEERCRRDMTVPFPYQSLRPAL
jgi:Zn-finger nucleic acid-binding protein